MVKSYRRVIGTETYIAFLKVITLGFFFKIWRKS